MAGDFGAKRQAERKRLAARRAENMRRSPTGQVLETYRPDTLGGELYDVFGRAVGGIRGMFGGSEDDALRARLAGEEKAREIGEFVVGPEEVQRSGRRIAAGQGDAGDYATVGLTAVPFLPKPVKALAARGVRAAGRAVAGGVKRAAPESVKRGAAAVKRYMTEVKPLPAAPDFIEGSFSVRPGAVNPMAAKPQLTTARTRPMALPPAEVRLGLPAPGPGLPAYAVKPRGGQFYPDAEIAFTPRAGENELDALLREITGNTSPENAARTATTLYADVSNPEYQPWLQKALARYYKTDFGSPDDPLRALAEQGLHYDPEMTPERWQKTVNSYLMEDPIGAFTVPGTPGYNPERAEQLLAVAPWLAKQPVTDKLYGISSGGLDLGHFNDEMRNALNAEASGLPADLAVRPEALARMSFPQAVERVGRINQFRAKEMERAALSNLDSPAVQLFREYPENNPMGLRWVELKHPELSDAVLSDEDRSFLGAAAEGDFMPGSEAMRETQRIRAQEALEKALKYEGDTMGHCVGGYCRDVMSGRSQIFSLRDAKGQPHVTVETRPSRRLTQRDIPSNVFRDIDQQAQAMLDADIEARGGSAPKWERDALLRKYTKNLEYDWLDKQPPLPSDIVQIKGKQNRAPNDEYLPFVQDFVKSGQWGNIGDLRNTQLVKLPDGRYITYQQAEEGIRAMPGIGPHSYEALQDLSPEEWAANKVAFEGYAIGGRVDADRCFCRNPLSVKR